MPCSDPPPQKLLCLRARLRLGRVQGWALSLVWGGAEAGLGCVGPHPGRLHHKSSSRRCLAAGELLEGGWSQHRVPSPTARVSAGG